MNDLYSTRGLPFNPKNWWWYRESDNTLYSSLLKKKMFLDEAEKNPDFISFKKKGGMASDWPYDSMGIQTDHELERTLKLLYKQDMYPPSLDDIKADQIKIIKKETGQAIILGFLSRINGKNYLFPFDETDQLNFTSQMALIQNNAWSPLTWRCYPCDDSGIVDKSKPLTIKLEKPEAFVSLYQTANRHKTEILTWSWNLQEKIQKAKTEDDVKAISWTYPPTLTKFVIRDEG